MNKKKVFAIALAVCMIAILSFSSLAWFTDKDTVTNKFDVATSDDPTDPEDVFSVDVWEGEDTDENGQIDDGEKDQDGLQFENVVPNGTYHKVPHVENTGAYDQWIRVKVSITCASIFDRVMDDVDDLFLGLDEQLWTRNDDQTLYDEAADTLTFVYYLNDKLAPDADVTLFTDVKLPYQLTREDMAAMNGSFSITVLAEAVQADNTGDSAVEAFALVEQTQPFINE